MEKGHAHEHARGGGLACGVAGLRFGVCFVLIGSYGGFSPVFLRAHGAVGVVKGRSTRARRGRGAHSSCGAGHAPYGAQRTLRPAGQRRGFHLNKATDNSIDYPVCGGLVLPFRVVSVSCAAVRCGRPVRSLSRVPEPPFDVRKFFYEFERFRAVSSGFRVARRGHIMRIFFLSDR